MILDMAHSLMERKAKRRNAPQIAVPSDWIDIARTVRPDQPFVVIEMTYSDFKDWKISNAPKGKLYADCFPNFKWKEGNRWGITRNSLCQNDSVNLEGGCRITKIPDYEMRRLSLKYGPPQAYNSRLKISVSKFESVLKYISNSKIPHRYVKFYYDLPVSGDDKIVRELKQTLRKWDDENVLD